MAIDSETKKLWNGEPWADTGDRADFDDASITPTINRTIGFPSSFSTTDTPARTRMNQLFRELSGAAQEVKMGISEYDAEVSYPVNAIVQVAGVLHRATVAHNPSNPVSPSDSGQVSWSEITGGGGGTPPAIPNSIPNADVIIDSSDGSRIAVYWNAPSDNRAAITQYDVRYSKSSTFASGVYTITNYTQGDPITANIDAGDADLYYVQVRATNSVGTPAWNTAAGKRVRSTPLSPDAISYFSAVPSNQAVALNWGAPNLHGMVLQRYVVQWKSGSQDWSETTRRAYITSGTSYTVGSLTNDTAYAFRVRAQTTRSTTNQGTFTATSTPVSTVVTATVPAAPIAPVAERGKDIRSIQGRLTATPNDGGSQITQYVFQRRHAAVGNTPAGNWNNGSTRGAPFIVYVNNGAQSTELRVKARNAIGDGPWSPVSAPIQALYPAPPATPVLAAEPSYTPSTGGGVIVYVTSHIDDHGVNITDIQWQRKLTSESGLSWTTIANSGTSTILERTETAGTSVDFRARVTGDAGTSQWSSSVTVVAPGEPPSARTGPTGMTIAARAINSSTSGGVGVVVAPTEPVDDGGSTITSFTWQYREKAGDESGPQPWTTWSRSGASADDPFVVMNFGDSEVGKIYEFRGFSVNSIGTSPASNTAEVTLTKFFTPDLPSALSITATPSNVNSSGGVGVLVTLASPSNDNSDPITTFSWQYKLSTSSSWLSGGSTTHPYQVINVGTAGVTYQFRARAANSIGTSPWSNVASATAVDFSGPSSPAAPATPTITAKATNASTTGGVAALVSLAAQINHNNSTITRFNWQYREKVSSGPVHPWTSFSQAGAAEDDPCVVINFTTNESGKTYEFQCTATNGVGTSAASNIAETTLINFLLTAPTAAPAAPVISAHPTTPGVNGGVGALVALISPSDDNGAAITKFTFEYREKVTGEGTPNAWTVFSRTGGALDDPYAVIPFQAADSGDTYEFRASATNARGTSGYSSTVETTLGTYTVPTTPIQAEVKATANNVDSSGGRGWLLQVTNSIPNATSYQWQGRSTQSTVWRNLPTTVVPYQVISYAAFRTAVLNGTPTEFRCRAVDTANNLIGSYSSTTSLGSAPTFEVPTSAAPSALAITAAPASPTSTGGVGALVTLTAPPVDNGATITAFTWQYKLSTASTWTTYSVTGDTVNDPSVLMDLGTSASGKIYNFRATATNSAGTSAASNVATATLVTFGQPTTQAVPDAPAIVAHVATPGAGGGVGALVSLTAPPDDNGSTITSFTWQYRVKVSSGSPNAWSTYSKTGAIVDDPYVLMSFGATSHGKTYEFRATATNGVGTSAASNIASVTLSTFVVQGVPFDLAAPVVSRAVYSQQGNAGGGFSDSLSLYFPTPSHNSGGGYLSRVNYNVRSTTNPSRTASRENTLSQGNFNTTGAFFPYQNNGWVNDTATVRYRLRNEYGWSDWSPDSAAFTITG